MAINKVEFGGNTLIDLTSDTVTADKLLSGYTAHRADGEQITGTYTPSAVEYSGMVVFNEYTASAYSKTDTTSVTGGIVANDAGAHTVNNRICAFVLNAKYTGSGTIELANNLTTHDKTLRIYIPLSLMPPGVTITTSTNASELGTNTFTREDVIAAGVYGVSCTRSTSGRLSYTIAFS